MYFILFLLLLFWLYRFWISKRKEEYKNKRDYLTEEPKREKKKFDPDKKLDEKFWNVYENCLENWDTDESIKLITVIFGIPKELPWGGLYQKLKRNYINIEKEEGRSFTYMMYLKNALDAFNSEKQLKGYIDNPLNYAISSNDIDFIVKTSLISYPLLMHYTFTDESLKRIKELEGNGTLKEEEEDREMELICISFSTAIMLFEIITFSLKSTGLLSSDRLDPQFILIEEGLKLPNNIKDYVFSLLKNSRDLRYVEYIKPTIEYSLISFIRSASTSKSSSIYNTLDLMCKKILPAVAIGAIDKAENIFNSNGFNKIADKLPNRIEEINTQHKNQNRFDIDEFLDSIDKQSRDRWSR